MTDFDSDPLDPLDELASAALDGDTNPGDGDSLDAETARALADRVAQLAQVRDLLAAPLAPPEAGARDRMIARAISVGSVAADDAAVADEIEADTPVVSLDRRRSRRTTRVRQFAPLAAAAAVLLVVAIVTPTLLDSQDDDVASSVIEPSTNAASEEMADTGGGDIAADEATAPARSADDGDTGVDGMEEDLAEGEASAAPGELVVPGPPAAATQSEEGFSVDELVDGEVSDEELLDAVIRYRALESAANLSSTVDEPACTDAADHPIDLMVAGTYRAEPALFFIQIDGSAVLAVTVVSPACEVLAEVTSD